jgi:hypothetical protein
LGWVIFKILVLKRLKNKKIDGTREVAAVNLEDLCAET